MTARSSSWFAALLILLVAGCGESGPKTVPVYGHVNFVGRDAPTWCHIYFTPTKTATVVRPVFAERQSSGSYAAKSFSTSRGLLPGTYRVHVNWYELKAGKDPNKENNWEEKSFDGGELVVDDNSSGVQKDFEIPAKT